MPKQIKVLNEERKHRSLLLAFLQSRYILHRLGSHEWVSRKARHLEFVGSADR